MFFYFSAAKGIKHIMRYPWGLTGAITLGKRLHQRGVQNIRQFLKRAN